MDNMNKNKYQDRICKKCGRLVKANEYGSHVYFPCRECNDEFWEKWYKLPKVRKVENKFLYTDEHIRLIKEYYKEDYFKL
jgi:tRNA(Ile2) C34 agmatinyltransferase TiaS